MTTVSRRLPERTHLDVPKREARELFDQSKKGEKNALERIRRRHPKFKDVTDDMAIAIGLKLNDAQLVVARIRPVKLDGAQEAHRGELCSQCVACRYSR